MLIYSAAYGHVSHAKVGVFPVETPIFSLFSHLMVRLLKTQLLQREKKFFLHAQGKYVICCLFGWSFIFILGPYSFDSFDQTLIRLLPKIKFLNGEN